MIIIYFGKLDCQNKIFSYYAIFLLGFLKEFYINAVFTKSKDETRYFKFAGKQSDFLDSFIYPKFFRGFYNEFFSEVIKKD